MDRKAFIPAALAVAPTGDALRVSVLVAAKVGLAALLTLHLVGCSAPAGSPTAPTLNPPARGSLNLYCPASLLTFESSVCSGAARTSTGQTVLLWAPGAGTWSAAPPGVVEVDDSGRVTGLSGGVATVSVSYGGMTATASVVVKAEDGIRIASGGSQGGPTPGTTAWMALSGYYSVVSADTGQLRVEVRNQAGIVIGVKQQAVTRGGGRFFLDASYSAPTGTTEVCSVAVLQLGGLRIEEPQNDSPQRFCIRATP